MNQRQKVMTLQPGLLMLQIKIGRNPCRSYKKALDNLGENVETAYYVCNFCETPWQKRSPDICSVYGAPKKEFVKID